MNSYFFTFSTYRFVCFCAHQTCPVQPLLLLFNIVTISSLPEIVLYFDLSAMSGCETRWFFNRIVSGTDLTDCYFFRWYCCGYYSLNIFLTTTSKKKKKNYQDTYHQWYIVNVHEKLWLSSVSCYLSKLQRNQKITPPKNIN